MTRRIMVIDHNTALLEMFEALLSGEGYEVTTRGFGSDVVQEIVRVRPDLLILDYVGGAERLSWQLIQDIHAAIHAHRTRLFPMIICTTAVKFAPEMQRFLDSNPVPVVYKPFDIDSLMSVVIEALRSTPTTSPPSF